MWLAPQVVPQGGTEPAGVHTGLLSPSLRRTLVDAAVVAKDMVVCGFRTESSEWTLAVWRGWGSRDFEVFYRSYEGLGRLEACPRRRR